MRLCAWGMYPEIEARKTTFEHHQELCSILKQGETIVYANGRSYGDCALAKNVVATSKYNNFLDFDESTGVLCVSSGVHLSQIIDAYLPKGWFLPVTPGTKLISIGGAIASDVHGKNHHVTGSFCDHVIETSVFDAPHKNKVICSKEYNPELFLATCGGMGLTGVILDAKIKLKKVNSDNILQKSIKSSNLKETFDLFEKHSNYTYAAAWIDCLQKDDNIGRSILMFGEHSDDGDLELKARRTLSVPFNLPSFTLNSLSVKAFNYLYYRRQTQKEVDSKVSFDAFFYPLDAINNWNRIYGKNGFVQYQFVLPKVESFEGLTKILRRIADSGMGSFLAVLKLFGQGNENYLSFPQEGYTLALDFKIQPGLFELLNELDKIVVAHKGRIYLAKDARVSKETFQQGYKNVDKFRQYRAQKGLDKQFNSLQSKRLGL